MTDTTTEHVPAGTLLQVPLSELVLDENIRAEVRLDDPFVESIRKYGVRVPIEVRQDPLGQFLIVDGQRRYLAAIDTDQPTVPVIVTDGIGDDESRITEQWILNEHRASLTPAERAAAVEQLSLFGRSTSAIAKKLGTSEVDVIAGLAVANTPKALEVLAAEPTMDLLTAAKLAEFADDEEVFADLAETAAEEPEALDHELQWARQNRAVRLAKAERVKELAAAGVRVVDDGEGVPLHVLSATAPTSSSAAPMLTDEEHAACPHRAVSVSARWGDGTPEVSVRERCLDLKAAGHHRRFPRDQEHHAEGAEAEALAAAKSAERKHTIKQNAASDAAQEVRHRFITDHLLWERDPKGRITKVPDGAVQHIAAVIAQSGTGMDYESRTLLTEWERGKSLPAPGSSRPAAERALLRRVLALGEAALPRTFWRSHHYAGNYSLPDGAPVGVLHLRRLEAWGYALAPIEREYLEAWDAAVAKHNEAEARRAAERAAAKADA